MWNQAVWIRTVQEPLYRKTFGSVWTKSILLRLLCEMSGGNDLRAVEMHWCRIQHQHWGSSGGGGGGDTWACAEAVTRTHRSEQQATAVLLAALLTQEVARGSKVIRRTKSTPVLSAQTPLSLFPCSLSPSAWRVQGASSAAVKVWQKQCQWQLSEEPAFLK